MGSGPRFSIGFVDSFGIGFYVSRFPHSVAINLNLLNLHIYIGFGKGYDE